MQGRFECSLERWAVTVKYGRKFEIPDTPENDFGRETRLFEKHVVRLDVAETCSVIHLGGTHYETLSHLERHGQDCR